MSAKITEKISKAIINVAEKTIKRDANSTTSAWAFQPAMPTMVKKYKK